MDYRWAAITERDVAAAARRLREWDETTELALEMRGRPVFRHITPPMYLFFITLTRDQEGGMSVDDVIEVSDGCFTLYVGRNAASPRDDAALIDALLRPFLAELTATGTPTRRISAEVVCVQDGVLRVTALHDLALGLLVEPHEEGRGEEDRRASLLSSPQERVLAESTKGGSMSNAISLALLALFVAASVAYYLLRVRGRARVAPELLALFQAAGASERIAGYLARGQPRKARQAYRAEQQGSLHDAEQAIERMRLAAARPDKMLAAGIPQSVLTQMGRGAKIAAIQAYWTEKHVPLREAKAIAERLMELWEV